MDAIKNNEERMKKQARELTADNQKYVADLRAAQENAAELGRQLANYEKNKQCLAVSTKEDC